MNLDCELATLEKGVPDFTQYRQCEEASLSPFSLAGMIGREDTWLRRDGDTCDIHVLGNYHISEPRTLTRNGHATGTLAVDREASFHRVPMSDSHQDSDTRFHRVSCSAYRILKCEDRVREPGTKGNVHGQRCDHS